MHQSNLPDKKAFNSVKHSTHFHAMYNGCQNAIQQSQEFHPIGYNYHLLKMYANRGDTIQPNGYLEQNRPNAKELEMQTYKNSKEPQKYTYRQEVTNQPTYAKEVKEEESSCGGYILHWVAFIVATGVYIGVWAVDYFAIQRQASYYYKNAFTASSTIDVVSYSDSTQIFSTTNAFDTLGITVSLAYSWVLWKAPLVIYSYHLIEQQESKVLKFVCFIGEFIILLAIDVLLTIFASSFYNDWLFYAAYFVLTLIVAIVNNNGLGKTKEAILNTIIPLLIIAVLYAVYCILLPSLYYLYSQNLASMSAIFLVIYAYPAIDLLIYSLVLLLGNKVEDSVKGLFSAIHFMLIGYGAGMILIVGYTEVEFYYLIGYFIFRNVFVNHIMRKWERVVANPPALPGWGIIYYVSYGLSFIPVIGVGKVVIAKSFMSYIFAYTSTLLYGTYNPLYPSSSPPSTALPNLNVTMGGNIFWLSGLIIWLGMTLSQRYDRKSPRFYDFFYYLLGIYLFYIGIACSLSLATLTASGHF